MVFAELAKKCGLTVLTLSRLGYNIHAPLQQVTASFGVDAEA